jgi:AcrR family transcriptional regulator
MNKTATGHLRADAARNREALLTAARAVFSERGLEAPLDEIARRAGVGNATLYRRFPTREALVEAVFAERMAEYAEAVDDALDNDDPWTGFRDYLLRILRLQAEDRALADLLVTISGEPGGELERLHEHAFEGTMELVDRAKAAGELRADFQHQDIVLLLMANAGLVHRTADAAPDSWRRVAAFILDGLHADAATPSPPAPTEDAVRAAMSDQACDMTVKALQTSTTPS